MTLFVQIDGHLYLIYQINPLVGDILLILLQVSVSITPLTTNPPSPTTNSLLLHLTILLLLSWVLPILLLVVHMESSHRLTLPSPPSRTVPHLQLPRSLLPLPNIIMPIIHR